MTASPSTPVAEPLSRGRVAQLVAAAVDDVPGVRRSSGGGVEVATQYPGGRVVGVLVSPERVTISIVAEDLRVRVLAGRVHDSVGSALAAAGQQRLVTVVVDDIDLVRSAGPS